jgi:hypothetical protein
MLFTREYPPSPAVAIGIPAMERPINRAALTMDEFRAMA